VTKADRAAANRTRRLKKKVDEHWARPGAAERVVHAFARMDADPAFAASVGRRLAKGLQLSARRADAGKTGGIAAGRSMTAEERITRAHKGGVAVFYRGGNASTYGKYLVDRREKKRRHSRLKLVR
jgi:hypothetical protein